MSITTEIQTQILARKVERGDQLLTFEEGWKTVEIVRHTGIGIYVTFSDGRVAYLPHGETVTVR